MNPLSTTLLTLLGTLVIVALTAVINNSRLSDLRSSMESRFDSLQITLDARFAEQKAELLRVEQVMDVRLKHLEEHLR